MVHRSTSELSLDDIVFNHRNRAYGAFQLREVYNSNLIKSLLIVFLLFSISLLLPKAFRGLFPAAPLVYKNEPIIESHIDISKTFHMETLKPILAPLGTKSPAQPASIPTKIVDNDKIVDALIPENTGLINTNPVVDGLPTTNSGSVDGVVDATPTLPTIALDPPVTWANQKQVFKRGNFGDFLGEKINFPSQAQNLGIEGKVHVEFIIEKDGTVSYLKVLKGVEASLDDEALRVIRLSSGLWDPARMNDIPVRIKVIQAISFKLH